MDNYRCYLMVRVQIFKSSGQDLTREKSFTLGASFGLSDGDPDGCTSCDGDFDDNVTFSFHTCLGCGLVIGGVGSSFTNTSGSSSSHSFHQGWFL